MRKLVALACFAALMLAGGAAYGKGGKPKVRADAVASIVLNETAPTYGSSMTFTTVVPDLTAQQYTYITVVCSQDTVVYQWSSLDLAFAFPLVQQDGLAAIGLLIDTSRPMSCIAALVVREDFGTGLGSTIDYAAQTEFTVA
jgi:hypothetical protein